ncbi:hypothetical protein BDE02_10G062400 [Populus trichocarpa]|nr:hypothetical protein BDE02_10G062400 [Populus trichocarpa]
MEVNVSFSNDMDDEYEKLFRRLNPPRVVIDNEACKNATVIRVDSANKHGILLEVDSANKMCLGMTAFAIDFLAYGFMDSFVGILYQAY